MIGYYKGYAKFALKTFHIIKDPLYNDLCIGLNLNAWSFLIEGLKLKDEIKLVAVHKLSYTVEVGGWSAKVQLLKALLR